MKKFEILTLKFPHFNSTIFRRNLFVLLFCLLISTLFLFICTKSSPLYPINDWSDSNASFTMGKSMMNGRILYKDIFNHKGPLLYTMHGLSYLISNKTFHGVYLFEVFLFSVFLFFSYKIVRIYLEDKYALLAIPIITYLILNNKNFSHGDNPEEFGMAFLIISLFHLLKYLKFHYPNVMDKKIVLLNGFFAGCIIWMKYSLAGFCLGWIVIVFISSLTNKKYINAVLASFFFLFGIFLATLPFIIYFGINRGIKDWIDGYIFVNLFHYPKNLSFWKTILFIIRRFGRGITSNVLFAIISFFGISVLIFSNYFVSHKIKRLYIIIPFLILLIGIYGGGKEWPYYFIIMLPISIFGVIYFIHLLKKSPLSKYYNEKMAFPITLFLSALLYTHTLFFNHNIYMLKMKKEDLIQHSFAEIISQTKNATLLNYGMLDVGLYTTTGIIPNIKYFQRTNIPYTRYPVIIDEQNRYLEEKLVNYVVTREFDDNKESPLNLAALHKNYYLIKKRKQKYGGHDFIYKLYKVK